MNVTAEIANFGGLLRKVTHFSTALNCEMRTNVFFPKEALANNGSKFPVLYYLSGLTCTPDNCTEKGFFQKYAAEEGIIVVYPDTSPRGCNLPGEDDAYDFGSGAGFYLNATAEPWNKHYHMYDYVASELPQVLSSQYPQLDTERASITGHSMGGHGALTLFLQNPGLYKSVSAFAPICNPTQCPWGEKAFGGYLASKEEWTKYDASELVKNYKGPTPEILIDQGTADNFYVQKQLLPENFLEASKGSNFDGKVNLRMQEGYDHSYFFMASFAEDHVRHAAKYLKN